MSMVVSKLDLSVSTAGYWHISMLAFTPLSIGTHIHGATEVRCLKSPGMDHVETRTISCHLHLDRSRSGQARKVKALRAITYFETKSKEAQELDAELVTKYSEMI